MASNRQIPSEWYTHTAVSSPTTGCLPRKTSLHFIMSVEQAKRTSTYRTMTSDGRIFPFPLWLRTWFSWWLPPCWKTSISISSVISAIRSSHWKRQAGWKPLSCILSACQQNGCALEVRTFWTYIQIKPTTLKSSLNKQYFFWLSYFPIIGLGGEFHDNARTKNPWKSPYQWINPKNVTSIYKSTSQEKILRN